MTDSSSFRETVETRSGLLFSGWLSHFGRSFYSALRYMAVHLVSTYFVWLLIGISLWLPASGWLLYSSFSDSASQWRTGLGFTIYFEVGGSGIDIDSAIEDVRSYEEINVVQVTSSSDALEDLIRVSEVPEALLQPDVNPLPASVVVELVPAADQDTLHRISEELSQNHRVIDEISVARSWLNRAQQFQEVLWALTVLLAVLLGTAAVLITSAAVRLAINDRVDELHVLEVLGSTTRFQKMPFELCGLLFGFGGGLMSALLISLTVKFLQEPLSDLYATYGESFAFEAFNVPFVLTLIGTSTLLGLLSASISASVEIRAHHKRYALNW